MPKNGIQMNDELWATKKSESMQPKKKKTNQTFSM